MSFAALLVHPLAIVTPSVPDQDDVDEYGQPVPGEPTTELVAGLVQPATAREQPATGQGGAPYSSHVIFLLPRQLSGAAYIRDEPDTGRRFEVVGVRSYEYGSSPHLEVDAQLVGSSEGPSVPDGS